MKDVDSTPDPVKSDTGEIPLYGEEFEDETSIPLWIGVDGEPTTKRKLRNAQKKIEAEEGIVLGDIPDNIEIVENDS